MKLIICFKKMDKAKYISHLDLQRTVGRCFRRSGVDVLYSSGYNPHIQMSFAFALKVGLTSQNEYLEVEVDDSVDVFDAETRLKEAFVDGIDVNWVRKKKEGTKKLMASVSFAGYKIYVDETADFDKIETSIDNILSKETLELEKKTKKGLRAFDARPLIEKLFLDREKGMIYALLSAQEKGTLDPKLLLENLMLVEGYNYKYTIIRENLYTVISDRILPLSALTE